MVGRGAFGRPVGSRRSSGFAPDTFGRFAGSADCVASRSWQSVRLAAGITGWHLGTKWTVFSPNRLPIDAIMRAFIAVWWMHSASYYVGFAGGIVVIVSGVASRGREAIMVPVSIGRVDVFEARRLSCTLAGLEDSTRPLREPCPPSYNNTCFPDIPLRLQPAIHRQWSNLMIRLKISFLAIVAAGLFAGGARADDDKPIRALLVLGGCCHDYAKQKDIITKGISARANVQWTIAYDKDPGTKHLNPIYEKDDWAKDFDVIVHDECCSDVKNLEVIGRILKPHREGLPGVVLHCGMHCYRSEGWPKTTPWFEFTGLASTDRHGAQLPIEITFVDTESPITKGMEDWTTINEELYNNSNGKLQETAQPLARGKQVSKDKNGKETSDETIVAWTNTYNGKTKVFSTTLGHNNATVADAKYLDLITRGLLWSVG